MNERSSIADTNQRSRDAFKRWFVERFVYTSTHPHDIAGKAWQAACQYKDEQLQELDSILRPANPETPHIGDMKLTLEELLREHKAYADHIELLGARIAEQREVEAKLQGEINHMEARIAELEADRDNWKQQAEAESIYASSQYDQIKELEAQRVPEWISVDDRIPAIGEKVILFGNGVVQEGIYEMDEADISDYHSERFWARDDLDECPKVESGQFWMPLPAPPAPTGDEDEGNN